MRSTTLLASAAVIVVVGAVWLKVTSRSPEKTGTAPARGADGIGRDASNQLRSAIAMQSQLSALARADADDRIRQLEARLESIESAASPKADDRGDKRAQDWARGRIAEADLGTWMEDRLSGRELDQVATSTVRAQLESALARLPGVELESVDCGERFCRAAFAQDGAEPPPVLDLMGAPPFTHEAFTLPEADGRVVVYLTRSGHFLDDLRKEAIAALTR